jgi:hypothetical protein
MTVSAVVCMIAAAVQQPGQALVAARAQLCVMCYLLGMVYRTHACFSQCMHAADTEITLLNNIG